MSTQRRTLRAKAAGAGIATTALVTAFAAGYAIAGRDGGSVDDGAGAREAAAGSTPLRLANAALHSATSCEELLDWYVERGVERVTPYGWDGGYVTWGYDKPLTSGISEDAARLPSTSITPHSDTGTNTQEAGVDEPDLVKTDGRLLVRVRGDRLLTYDVTGAEPALLSTLRLPGLTNPEILLDGDSVVAIGTDTAGPTPVAEPRDYGYVGTPTSQTRVELVDLGDPTAPALVTTWVVDSELVAARLSGGAVRLVLGANLPDLDFVRPARWRPESWALKHNQAAVRASTIDDWLPTVTTYDGTSDDGTTAPLVDCEDVALPEVEAGLGTMAVAGFDASAPADWSVTGVATDSQIAYLSTDRLYLATAGWAVAPRVDAPTDVCCWPSTPVMEDGTTRLYSFALDGTAARFVASGEVEGSVADRWAMDESGGVLRVAVGPTSETGNFNSIVTLSEEGDALVQLGRLDRLGVGEQITAVRWFDDLALLVTFRQVDPLYAVDLSSPSRPRLLGALKIPGFSSYLHPLGPRRVIGVGSMASGGAQAGLFDVTDLGKVRRMSVVGFGRSSNPQAAVDPRQFTWLPGPRVALTVIGQGWGRRADVAILTVEHGRLATLTRTVEWGSDLSAVRLVPLPDRRVALVTGEDVSFFDYSLPRR